MNVRPAVQVVSLRVPAGRSRLPRRVRPPARQVIVAGWRDAVVVMVAIGPDRSMNNPSEHTIMLTAGWATA